VSQPHSGSQYLHIGRYVEEPLQSSSSTHIDEPLLPGSSAPPTNALMSIVEMGMGGLAVDDRVRIGMVSVVPGTGDVVWDEFDGKIYYICADGRLGR
jgi:hypothetical protein